MPSLEWLGKDKIKTHHLKLPLRALERVYSFDENGQFSADNGSENKLIHGDNLEALKALLPKYEGKIKCVYIDPPYNTGSQTWVYDDSLSCETFNRWLEGVIGKESDALSRHDKWLCMIYPRLQLLHQLLAEDGVLTVSIDENESANLRLLLEEIFGSDNNLGEIIWNKKNPKGDALGISCMHETILNFAKNKRVFTQIRGACMRDKTNAQKILAKAKALWTSSDVGTEAMGPDSPSEERLAHINKAFQLWLRQQPFSAGEKAYRRIDAQGRVYRLVSMAWPNKKKAPDNYFIPLVHPITHKTCPIPARGWRNPPQTMQALLEEGLIIFGKDDKTQPCRKYYLDENMKENTPSIYENADSDDALLAGMGLHFEYAKPLSVVRYILSNIHPTATLVLDAFAGSGTTGHAVLEMNKADGGSRKFILIEMQEYAESITAERLKRVITGYGEGKKAVEATGGDFAYYTLGQPCTKDDGQRE